MKKILTCLLAAAMLLSLAACGSDAQEASATPEPTEEATPTPEPPATPEPTPTPEPTDDPNVESIDLETDSGRMVYNSYEYASPNLYSEYTPGDASKTIIINLDFTNKLDKPSEFYTAFGISVFQNGVELSAPGTIEINGFTEALKNFFYGASAMKDGTITIGAALVLKDYSPITIMVESLDDQKYQMMELVIVPPDGAAASNEVDTRVIEDALQGTWSISGGSFTFNAGSVVLSSQGSVAMGTYEINSTKSLIELTMTLVDGSASIELPYTYSDGQFELYNNNGEALVKG